MPLAVGGEVIVNAVVERTMKDGSKFFEALCMSEVQSYGRTELHQFGLRVPKDVDPRGIALGKNQVVGVVALYDRMLVVQCHQFKAVK